MSPDIERRWIDLSLQDVKQVARRLGQALAEVAPGVRFGLTVGLTGDLGAGKTTFAQALVSSLPNGSRCVVNSPTYAILQSYPTQPEVRHADLYRLSSPEELDAIGYGESLEAPGINLVEWIRQIPEHLPLGWVEIVLSGVKEDQRDLCIRAFGQKRVDWPEEVFSRVCAEPLASDLSDD